ncbi:thermonuclease family protein [Litoreibacter halocynthiae]|uniref:thermonuclease family protein n=1 Tax=Litoreibacter halocynthiae TaxID=1242689 RepID=UPI0024924D12|nr:thermonuclease family protein [Litoreibacter halocynthiae]
MKEFFVAFLFLFFPSIGTSQQADFKPYQGPYLAEVVRVIDGDTIDVRVELWPGLIAEYAVRERGIDAPEVRRVGCEEERDWGLDAKRKLEELYSEGTVVRLDDVERGSFAGRVLADIKRLVPSAQWIPLERDMLSRNLAVEWTPNMKDVPWCLLAQTR